MSSAYFILDDNVSTGNKKYSQQGRTFIKN